jgi:hypothetical protein
MTKKRMAIGGVLIVVVAAIVFVTTAGPTVAYWRARYWLQPGGRVNALARLDEAAPRGASLELRHARQSANPSLKMAAGVLLCRRGDPRGIECLGELYYEHPDGHIKFNPRKMLAERVDGDMELEKYGSAEEWKGEVRGRLRYLGEGRWQFRGTQ